ncbi:MAG: rhodanese-like domain-containing protein [Cocleimonas sp.]|nr:rhodanese-like domain-containing protein [Cocleimonas sp.]
MKYVTTMSSQKAYALLQDNPHASLVDIRSSMEYLFVGHPVGSVHIAWIDDPDWDLNPDFIDEVTYTSRKKNAHHHLDNPIVLICRSGVRTLLAAKALIDAGFTQIIHIDEGFEGDRNENDQRSSIGGWRYHGLPWEQC